ncbi:hypothetical protein Tco_0928423 [Tanacetum coccineum]
MCTYLKNMKGYNLKDLKMKEFDSIQEMFDRAFKRQKVEDDKETAEFKQCLEIILDKKEVTIDAIPLSVKSSKIMLKSFDKEDLEDLWKLVKAKCRSTRPVEDYDLLLWGDLKTMFEPHIEDEIWKAQQGYKVLSWKLYDSCGVHYLRMQSMQGRIVGIKSLFDVVGITAAHVLVTVAQLKYKSNVILNKVVIKAILESDVKQHSTKLVVNKEFVPPLDMCGMIPWALSRINQIIAWPCLKVRIHIHGLTVSEQRYDISKKDITIILRMFLELHLSNYGVFCEDELKGVLFGAKMKIFEESLILTKYAISTKKIQRISANTSQENVYVQFPIRCILPIIYTISSWSPVKDTAVNLTEGN